MRLFVLALLVAMVLPTCALAQDRDFMKMKRSQINREYHKDGNREKYRALWNGNGAVVSVIPIWGDEEFLRELDFTPE